MIRKLFCIVPLCIFSLAFVSCSSEEPENNELPPLGPGTFHPLYLEISGIEEYDFIEEAAIHYFEIPAAGAEFRVKGIENEYSRYSHIGKIYVDGIFKFGANYSLEPPYIEGLSFEDDWGSFYYADNIAPFLSSFVIYENTSSEPREISILFGVGAYCCAILEITQAGAE